MRRSWRDAVTLIAVAMAMYAVISFNHRIGRTFDAEKLCSETHRRACPALFERLRGSLSEGQKHRLACDVMLYLDTPHTRRIAEASRCPPRP